MLPAFHPSTAARKSCCTLVLACVLAGTGVRTSRAAGDLPLVNINGTLCVRVTLRCGNVEMPANVVLDLGTRGPMLVHYGTAALLGFQREGAVDVIHEQAGTTLSAVKSVAMELEPLEELTREHAKELGDIPAVAVIGLPAFSGMIVELDVAGNLLRILTKDQAALAPDEAARAVTLKYTGEAYGYWLTAQASSGTPLRVRFATSEYDTRINDRTAVQRGVPGGNLEPLMLGSIDLARYAVFRPSDLSAFPEPRPDLVTGTHLLSSFRVRVDPDGQQITFIPTREPAKAAEEQAFFMAKARRDVAAVEEFLKAHPDSRLAGEATAALLDFSLDRKPADPAAVRRALTLGADAVESQRRAMKLLDAADEFIAMDAERGDAYDLAMIAVDLARRFTSADLNDTAIHQVNARLGLLAMLRGDDRQARRYLLSAAFGLPRDPYINFYLGHLYERTGQRSRAWSRYLEACLKKNPPIGALKGLDRLNNDPTFRRDFTMLDAAQLLEGRVPVFAPPRTWQATASQPARPVRLVELFTNTGLPETQAAQIAFDALAQYLRPAGTLFLQYTIDDVLSSDAAEARAGFYGVQACPAAFFDGSGPITEGGEDEAGPKVFSVYREHCFADSSPTTQPAITGRAEVANGNLAVTIQLAPGSDAPASAMHVLLCEREVMAVSENGQVLHRSIVRAGLTPGQGSPLAFSRGTEFHCEAGLWSARQRLEQRIHELGVRLQFKPALHPTWIDPRACDVIVFVQEIESRRILAAASVPVHASSEEAP